MTNLSLDVLQYNSKYKKCPWCYEPAEHGVWTPKHGWIDLCQHHYNVTSRDVVGFLLEKLHSLGHTQEV